MIDFDFGPFIYWLSRQNSTVSHGISALFCVDIWNKKNRFVLNFDIL